VPALLLLAVALGLDNLAAAIGFGAGATGRELGARIGAAAGERSELIACLLLIVVGAVIAAGVL
jgi:putative Mn2+ efflux pump MntP